MRATESLPHGPTPVLWRRSARARRISLRIDPASGTVVVTLPPRAGQGAGRRLLHDNAGWVAERLARLPASTPLTDGATIPIGGEPHRIRHCPAARGGAWLEAAELNVAGDAAFLSRRVLDFLRAEARRRLTALALAKAGAAGLDVRQVVVRDTRTRWGSCTADGTLMFCWRLVMAPPLVQDYVAGHEVAHLRHMDHSPAFWALVSHLTPHRTVASRWLDREGAGLLRVG